VDALTRIETDYCEVEQDWFSRMDGAKRYVIRFADFVADLQTTMLGVYSFSPCPITVGQSVGAAIWNSMNAKAEADCEKGTTGH